jgi:nucleoside-triphosphatase
VNPLLLLTGPPGVGKTTALRRACEALRIAPLRGFFTEEVRAGGARQGFRLVTLDGEERVIADVRRPGAPRVGKYGVDVAAIDAVARRVLAPDPVPALFIIDEIGKMECLANGFVVAVRALLALQRPLFATIALRGEGLIEEVKRDPRARLVHLTRDNRDRMPREIARMLQRASA